MSARKKLGTSFEKSTLVTSYDFTKYMGYLKITKVTTNLLVGTVKESDLITKIMQLSPFDLARLKKLLKDFDSRLFEWKKDGKKNV